MVTGGGETAVLVNVFGKRNVIADLEFLYRGKFEVLRIVVL